MALFLNAVITAINGMLVWISGALTGNGLGGWSALLGALAVVALYLWMS